MNTRPYRAYQGKQRWASTLLWAGAVILLAAAIAYLAAPFSVRKFAAFPAAAGVFCILYGLTARCSPAAGKIARGILLAVLAVGVALFFVLLVVIRLGAHDDVRQTPDVMVIMGAQVKQSGPSVLLADRLETALTFLEENPALPVVVSGGQGPDEPSSEAAAMRDWLVNHGIDEARIWLEDASHNTNENLRLTRNLLESSGFEPEKLHLLVVSNGFHLTRIRMLAARMGLDISTLSAPTSHVPAMLQSYIREVPALIKSWLLDR